MGLGVDDAESYPGISKRGGGGSRRNCQVEVERQAFKHAVDRCAQQVSSRRFWSSIVKLLTLGFVKCSSYVEEAEAQYRDALDDLTDFDELSAEQRTLLDELSGCPDFQDVRLSQVGSSLVSVLGGQHYGSEWESIKQRILDRDGHACQEADGRCRGPFQVHHIVHLSKGGTNTSDNLIVLCRFHHSLKHQHMKG